MPDHIVCILEVQPQVALTLFDAKDVSKVVKSLPWAEVFTKLPKVDQKAKCVALGPCMLVRFRMKPAFNEFCTEFMQE